MLHFVFDCFADGENCNVMPTGSANLELYRPIEMHRKDSRYTAVLTSAYLGPVGSLSVLTLVMQVSRHKVSDMVLILGS
jgi:hypothetical protein